MVAGDTFDWLYLIVPTVARHLAVIDEKVNGIKFKVRLYERNDWND